MITDFGHSMFTYVLKAKKGIDALEASFEENTITLFLGDKKLSEWATSDRIGFSDTLDLPNGKQLSLLLEKDFACLDNTIEDQSDNYPNPKSGTSAC